MGIRDHIFEKSGKTYITKRGVEELVNEYVDWALELRKNKEEYKRLKDEVRGRVSWHSNFPGDYLFYEFLSTRYPELLQPHILQYWRDYINELIGDEKPRFVFKVETLPYVIPDVIPARRGGGGPRRENRNRRR